MKRGGKVNVIVTESSVWILTMCRISIFMKIYVFIDICIFIEICTFMENVGILKSVSETVRKCKCYCK